MVLNELRCLGLVSREERRENREERIEGAQTRLTIVSLRGKLGNDYDW